MFSSRPLPTTLYTYSQAVLCRSGGLGLTESASEGLRIVRIIVITAV